tara:strand:- start:137 stop:664 length:528 start_codon:yes stop_codon:yes gene_type:complete
VKKQDISENQANYAFLALGSNLGERINNLLRTKNLILKHDIKIIKSSSYYETQSWPNKKFPSYVNSVIFIKTSKSLSNLFLTIKYIEKLIGRTTSKKNYPRVCDIDIIDYNGKVQNLTVNTFNVSTPHKSMHIRNFVLFPLFEIAKTWIHPKLKKNIINLISSLPLNDLRSIKLI